MKNRIGERVCDWIITDYRGAKDVDIEHISTGERRTSIRYEHIKRHKSAFEPTTYGVGYLGEGDHKASENGKLTRLYQLWKGMFYRCYSGNEPSYSGCTVGERWHNFQHFAEDVKTLPNYAQWLANPGQWQIDKDLLATGQPIYSPETCQFITQSDNIREAMRRRWASLDD
ncbi:hypothetical protein EWD52_23440 [Salmonella enterica subsp. enterica serovar Braenderup]|nr:hypothetical protein [Salmonella enterica subsp. enterica serovar Braenderup]ECD1500253.1 hypothetical protein [Salmonella enterica subsp. enterica serovar Braenderup]